MSFSWQKFDRNGGIIFWLYYFEHNAYDTFYTYMILTMETKLDALNTNAAGYQNPQKQHNV